MSLINQMLQDLDARGGAPAGAATQAIIKPVLRGERRTRPLMAGGALLLLALAAGGYFGWRALQRPAPEAAAVADPVTPIKTVMLAPRQVPPAPAIEAAAEKPRVAPPEKHPALRPPVAAKDRAQPAKPRSSSEAPVPTPRQNQPVPTLATAAVIGAQPAQPRAESEYRRALATLQEGRVGEAIGSLERVLVIEPRHEAARQTLVGLLIENKRPDEATRQLQQALGADPRQPALAMLLARLQIEHGATGIDTLQRTLPYATGNAEYRAFLAGALQRQQRHREAAEQYQAALHTASGNGVWQMGLGISLQAEQRNAEAIDAFQKARAAPSLPANLLAFVDRRLQQLSH